MRARVAGVFAVIASSTLLLSACGGGEASTNKNVSGKPVTITLWSGISGFKAVADKFNATHKDIKLKFGDASAAGNAQYSKLDPALKAGNAPDIATIEYPVLPGYASSGDLVPLEDIEGGGDALKPYSEGVQGLVKLGGKTWGLPYDAPVQVLWYREDLYKAAGVTEAPKTWDDFAEAAKKLKAKNPKTHIASFFPNEPLVTAALAWQNGAKWFGTSGDSWKVNINDAATQKVGTYWQDMVDKGYVKKQQAWSDEWSADLASGTVASVVGATWSGSGIIARAKGQEGKWRVAELPNWGTPATGMWGGSTFAVTKDSKHRKEALEVMKWLTTDPAAFTSRGDIGSAVAAAPELTSSAKSAFDTSFFGGQDIYQVFDRATASLVKGWSWGPTMPSTIQGLTNGFGQVGAGTDINDALKTAQGSTVEDIKQTGLTVGE